MDAAKLGRDRSFPIRNDWEEIKESVMKKALYVKFSLHQDLKQILLSTYPQEIVEATSNDYYWGCGNNGTGLNRLGILLMEIRESLLTKEYNSILSD